jgi:hypothetical protein
MATDATELYLKLADEHDKLLRFQERDRFLLLAADAALSEGRKDEAEGIRKRLLGLNPSHLLKPYANLTEALQSQDIAAYVQQLRVGFPVDKAESLLNSLRGGSKKAAGRTASQLADEEFSLPMDADTQPSPPASAPVLSLAPLPESSSAPANRKRDRANPDPGQTARTAAPAARPGRVAPTLKLPPASGSTASRTGQGAADPGSEGLRQQRSGAAIGDGDPDALRAGGWVGAFLGLLICLVGMGLLAFAFLPAFIEELR